MAKLSLLKISQKRNKRLLFLGLSVLCLGFFMFQMLIMKAPKGARAAATLSCDTATPKNCTITFVSASDTYTINNSTLDGTNLTILGAGYPSTVTISGARTFKNLTIDNASLTHPAMTSADFDVSGNFIASSANQINISVTEKFTMQDHAFLDAIGKGGPGGTVSHPKGYGPSGGDGAVNTGSVDTASGGGGNGGNGGQGGGTQSPLGIGAGGLSSASSISQPGSGSGYSGPSGAGDPNGNGKPGGGLIHVSAQTIEFDGSSQYYARGVLGSSYTYSGKYAAVGGGGGGSIWLQTTNLIAPLNGMKLVKGGGTGGTNGGDGIFDHPGSTYTDFGGWFYANGGNGSTITHTGTVIGGGGGGGRIRIQVAAQTNVTANCNILGGEGDRRDYIPADCENQDVVIDGTGWVDPTPSSDPSDDYFTINMGKIQVSGDTHREFTSLTVKNNAVLTHKAVTVGDMTQDITGGNESLADETTGTARWKKVDVETTGDIIFDTGGRIDVTGKGYPAATSRFENIQPDYSDGRGYGPSGGESMDIHDQNDPRSRGAGGGNGGVGTDGYGGEHDNNTVFRRGGAVNTFSPPSSFDFGSGGGFAHAHNEPGGGACSSKTAEASGGAGAGRVKLVSTDGKIKFQNSYDPFDPATDIVSSIKADGLTGGYSMTRGGGWCKGVEAWAWGGGGAGGQIWLEAQAIEYPGNKTGFWPAHTLANGSTIVTGEFSSNAIYNLSADGIGSPRGGGGVIYVKLMQLPTLKFTKQIKPVTRSSATSGGIATNLTDFNPYALQSGDKIKVEISVDNIDVTASQKVTLTDDLLKILYGPLNEHKCTDADSLSVLPAAACTSSGYDSANDKVIWTDCQPSAKSTVFSYQCTISP